MNDSATGKTFFTSEIMVLIIEVFTAIIAFIWGIFAGSGGN